MGNRVHKWQKGVARYGQHSSECSKEIPCDVIIYVCVCLQLNHFLSSPLFAKQKNAFGTGSRYSVVPLTSKQTDEVFPERLNSDFSRGGKTIV